MRRLSFIAIIILGCTRLLFAQLPNFDYPCMISTPTGNIVPGNEFAVPCVGDWDDDGDLDLIVGVLNEGNVIFYENISTGSFPDFASGVLIEADGEVISVNYA